MATFLDVGFFQNFSVIFTFLFIFTLVFAVIVKVKLFDGEGIPAIIALSIAVLSLFSEDFIGLISSTTPWFVLMFVFILFIMAAAQFLGADLFDALSKTTFAWWIIAFSLLIIIIGFSQQFGQGLLAGENATSATSEGAAGTSGETTDFDREVRDTLFSPKILGLILIMLIGVFAIRLLSSGLTVD